MTIKYLLLAISVALLAAGCSVGKTEKTPSASPVSADTAQVQSKYIFAGGSLKQIQATTGAVQTSTQLPDDLAPITFMFNKSFQVNYDGSYVAWFVPGKGLVRWRQADKSVNVFYEPTEWFYENPYFTFAGKTNTVVLIDKKGSEVIWYDLDTKKATSNPVPYPFGTIFVISPDQQKMVFVEGYGQTSGSPTYLVSTVTGDSLLQFKTKAEIANRFLIAWTPDSKALIAVENSNELVRYTIDNFDTGNTVAQLPDGEKIVGLQPYGNYLFLTSDSSWYLFDMQTDTVVKRLPVDVAAALNKPRLIPFDEDHFYIEEDVRSFEQTYKRLWVFDWMGVKKIVVPEYGRRVTDTDAF